MLGLIFDFCKEGVFGADWMSHFYTKTSLNEFMLFQINLHIVYHRIDAIVFSFWEVYDFEEVVQISLQPDKTLIIDTKNYIFFASIAIIYISTMIFLLLIIFSLHQNEVGKRIFNFFLGLVLVASSFFLYSPAQYHFKENSVYLSYSKQTTGKLTGYKHRICETGKNENRKRYDCYARIITYSPLGSFDEHQIIGNVYRRKQKWAKGTNFEVVYLKSNEKSARILDTIEHGKLWYIMAFFAILIFLMGVKMIVRTFQQLPEEY